LTRRRVKDVIELEVVAPALCLAMLGWILRIETGIHELYVVALAALPPQVLMWVFVGLRRSRGAPTAAALLVTETLVLAAAALGALAPLP
jgi:hypothetical protein